MDADYIALVKAVKPLMSVHPWPKDPIAGPQAEESNGASIPPSLGYLHPQRVWNSADAVEIELLHMMDADTTIYVEREKDGTWSVSGHFGDYMNKPRVLWKQPNSKALDEPEKPSASQRHSAPRPVTEDAARDRTNDR